MGSSKSSRTSVISAPTAYMPAATKQQQHSRPSTADSIFSETGYGHSLLDQHVTRAVRLAATPAPNYRPKSRATIIRAPAPGLGWAGADGRVLAARLRVACAGRTGRAR